MGFSSSAEGGVDENHSHREASKQSGNQKQSVVVFFMVIHLPILPVARCGPGVPTLNHTSNLNCHKRLHQLG
jgi:hypothetical protein